MSLSWSTVICSSWVDLDLSQEYARRPGRQHPRPSTEPGLAGYRSLLPDTPSSAARAAASRRSGAPSLSSTAATWLSTVRTESTSSVGYLGVGVAPGRAGAARRPDGRSARPGWPGSPAAGRAAPSSRPARAAGCESGRPAAGRRARRAGSSAISIWSGSRLSASAAARSYGHPARGPGVGRLPPPAGRLQAVGKAAARSIIAGTGWISAGAGPGPASSRARPGGPGHRGGRLPRRRGGLRRRRRRGRRAARPLRPARRRPAPVRWISSRLTASSQASASRPGASGWPRLTWTRASTVSAEQRVGACATGLSAGPAGRPRPTAPG